MTDRAWLSRLLWHLARKRSGSILTPVQGRWPWKHPSPFLIIILNLVALYQVVWVCKAKHHDCPWGYRPGVGGWTLRPFLSIGGQLSCQNWQILIKKFRCAWHTDKESNRFHILYNRFGQRRKYMGNLPVAVWHKSQRCWRVFLLSRGTRHAHSTPQRHWSARERHRWYLQNNQNPPTCTSHTHAHTHTGLVWLTCSGVKQMNHGQQWTQLTNHFQDQPATSIFCSCTKNLERITAWAETVQYNTSVFRVSPEDTLLPPSHGQLAPHAQVAPPITLFYDKVWAH